MIKNYLAVFHITGDEKEKIATATKSSLNDTFVPFVLFHTGQLGKKFFKLETVSLKLRAEVCVS